MTTFPYNGICVYTYYVDLRVCIWKSKCVHVYARLQACMYLQVRLDDHTTVTEKKKKHNFICSSPSDEFSCCECEHLGEPGGIRQSEQEVKMVWDRWKTGEERGRCVSENAQSGRVEKSYNSFRAGKSCGVEWCWKCQDGTPKTELRVWWKLLWSRGLMQKDRWV